MKVIFFKLQVLLFVLCLLALGVQAQDPRFIYIQTDNQQPFYVKIDKLHLNSSPTGYIIIARLLEDNYRLSIGFSTNDWPELNVTVTVKDGNVGFLLKRSGNKDWTLTNLLTMKTVAIEKQVSAEKKAETVQSTDAFARILAEVVNDPSIAEVVVEKNATETVRTDDQTTKTPVLQDAVKTAPVDPGANGSSTSKIEKLKEDSTAEGLLMTYRDNANADTVKIFVPVNTLEAVEKAGQAAPADTMAKKAAPANRDVKFIDMELQNPNLKTDSGAQRNDFVITQTESKPNPASNSNAGNKMINPDCKISATENDFLKLRKRMAGEATEKDMTKTAIKQFITTCYTSEQVKILGALFITEEERYKFFVAAFPHVWDTANFSALEDQLKEEYYKTRFKAMFNR